MPRVARNIREPGYRHVIIRGVGKQILFEDSSDNMFFIKLLEKYSKECRVKICAYCLMENHVHLLVHDSSTDTALFMKKMGVSYSAHYNGKYERTGHLFQDRYKCENITDARGYLTVLRYILRNPEKAGVCKTEEYRWSSFSLYGDRSSFLDQSFTRELLRNKDDFAGFIKKENNDMCMEYESKRDDRWAKEKIDHILGGHSGTVIQKYDKKERNRVIRLLKDEGLSVRQIERLTGINRGVVQKA